MALYQVTQGSTINATDVNQFDQLLTGVMTDQQVTVSNRIRAQLTGATATSGYVGGTASGPPTAGTFQLGDFVVDQSGTIWICTASGSPGTWVPSSATNLHADVYRSTNLSVSATTWTALMCDTKLSDPFNIYSTSTGAFTCPLAGRYLVSMWVSFGTAVGTTEIAVGLWRNNNQDLLLCNYSYYNGFGGAYTGLQRVNAGDTLTPEIYLSGANTLTGGVLQTGASVTYLGS
jgi:hypothetical protein